MISIDQIKNNGIIGAGGAGFPTHVKLDSTPDTIIMNAAECEPLLHKDMQLLKNYTDLVLKGFLLTIELTKAKQGIIGIKKKHKSVIELLKKEETEKIKVIEVEDVYPAGDEVTLIYMTTGRVVQPGQLPISVGCVVQNVETLYNIGKCNPVTEKFISVAGAVEDPSTIKVPIGISYKEILNKFKINVAEYKLRIGGLMMGHLESNLDNVVSKRTGALIVLPSDHHCVTIYNRFSTPHATDIIAKAGCDQCTFCTELCPRYLLGHPVRPEVAMRNRMFSREDNPLLDIGSFSCCECNLCTMYACPEGLDPKGATVIEKVLLREQKSIWSGTEVSPHPMIEYRNVPTKKLMQRLDVLKFVDEGPLKELDLMPTQVKVPLNQHIGAPSQPIVKVNDRVLKSQLIAEGIGRISSNIHASIDGIIKEISDERIVIERYS